MRLRNGDTLNESRFVNDLKENNGMNRRRMKINIMTGGVASGVLLLACAILSFTVANTKFGASYLKVWSSPLGGQPLSTWINEGLMAFFFLLVGLELKREILYGELKSSKQAVLPLMAALGGMLVPAAIYVMLNWGEHTLSGFGIPMATDIVFVVAILTALGKRVPSSLRIFVLTLAVVDDLGAVLVIALFYTAHFQVAYLMLAIMLLLAMILLGQVVVPRSRVGEAVMVGVLLLLGVGVWSLFAKSGIPAGVCGVLVALAIPSLRYAEQDSPAVRLERKLQLPVYLLVLPIFVLSNTAIQLPQATASMVNEVLAQPYVLGIAVSLFVGKPLGVMLGSWLTVALGWGTLPREVHAVHVVGVGFLCGIGFTMAIFIAAMAFQNPSQVDVAVLTVLVTSILSAVVGTVVLCSNRKTVGTERIPKAGNDRQRLTQNEETLFKF